MKLNISTVVLLILLLFAITFASCNGEPPPPPPPECGENEVLDDDGKTCICQDGYERNDEGDCVEIPPPPCGENEYRDADGICQCLDGYVRDDEGKCIDEPSTDSRPEDYYTLTRAGTFDAENPDVCSNHTGMVEEICVDLCPWACWRDPEWVATYCSWGCSDGEDPVFDLTAEDMLAFSKRGLELNRQGEKWMAKLPTMNRRGDPSHPEYNPRFEGRSEVRKNPYPNGEDPAYKKWRAEFDAHLAKANEMRDAAQARPIRENCAYDSIKGWCQCENKARGGQ